MKKFLHNLLFPPTLLLICILATIYVPKYYCLGTLIIPTPYSYIFGSLTLFLGLILLVRTNFLIRKKHKSEIHTFKEPSHLITDWPYNISRNPMYLSMLIMLIGIAIIVARLSAFAFPIIFFVVSYCWYIPFEEKQMQKKFGDNFDEYKTKTRRWF